MKFEEFNRRFEANISKYPKYTNAYEATEQEHVNLTGGRRYSDYDSFRNARKRRI